MTDADRLKRVLLALPDGKLRLGWLESELSVLPISRAARMLNAVIEQSEAADPAAREAHMTIALMFVGRAEAPLTLSLRREATSARLFSLERLLRAAPKASTPAPRAEEPARIPDYGAGRELSLGERRSLARKPTRRAFERLLSDPHPMVIRQLLQNPKLVEDDALRLAARRPAQAETLRELARSPRWVSRQRVRLALLLNPFASPDLTLPLLGLCTRTELADVLRSTDIPAIVRVTARELLDRRPPMPADVGPRTIQ